MAWDASPVGLSWRGTANGTTSGTVDTSGKTSGSATIIAVLAGGATVQTISDNAGNSSWQYLTFKTDSGGLGVRIAYHYAAATKVGHTFTNAGSGTYGSCHVLVFNGGDTTSAVFEHENGAVGAAVSVLKPGSTALDAANDLAIVGLATATLPDVVSIDSSYTKNGELYYDGSTSFSGVMGWRIVPSSPTDPQFSWASVGGCAAVIGTFKAASGGGGGTADLNLGFNPVARLS